MATGDLTYKTVKITVDDETGIINYATEKYIEDDNGDTHRIGALHRPGPVPPRIKNSSDEWVDNVITDKPQVIQDIATATWNDSRAAAYEAQFS